MGENGSDFKQIELIVLQEGKPQRMKLAQVYFSLSSEKPYYLNPPALTSEVWEGISEAYSPRILIDNYLEGVQKTQRLFAEILKDSPQEEKANLETIASHPFVYASPEAYEKVKPKFKKEKEGDGEINSIAHISWNKGIKKGIFILLGQNYSFETLLASNIHEHGHYMHQLLQPEKYLECDFTMIEARAIFVEIKCGIRVKSASGDSKEETPHIRAKKMLRQLWKNKLYQSMNVAEQWKFLSNFTSHEVLQECLNEKAGYSKHF